MPLSQQQLKDQRAKIAAQKTTPSSAPLSGFDSSGNKTGAGQAIESWMTLLDTLKPAQKEAAITAFSQGKVPSFITGLDSSLNAELSRAFLSKYGDSQSQGSPIASPSTPPANTPSQTSNFQGRRIQNLAAQNAAIRAGTSQGVSDSTVASTAPIFQPQAGAGATEFNTGDPKLDKFLNETYLPLVEAEFADDPLKALDPAVFAKITERVNATYGPIFQNEINRAEQAISQQRSQLSLQHEQSLRGLEVPAQRGFEDINTQRGYLGEDQSRALEESGFTRSDIERQVQGLDLQKAQGLRSLEIPASRTLEDVSRQESRLGEDKIRALADNARSYDEIKLQTSNNYRQRGLTFSGLRGKQEGKNEEQNVRNVGDIEQASRRASEDLTRTRGRTSEDLSAGVDFLNQGYGLQRAGIDSQLAANARSAGDIRTQGLRQQQQLGLSESRLGQDLGANRDFLTRSLGLNQQALDTALSDARKQIEGERTLQYADEKKRLRDLGATILANS